MSKIDELVSDIRGTVVVLEIDGTAHRWYGGGAPPAASGHTDVEALADVGAYTEEISLAGGLVRGGAMGVTVVADGETLARERLCPLPRGAVILGYLSASLDKDASLTTIYVTSTAGFAAGTNTVWVNGEACEHTGTAAGPARLTGVTRAMYGDQTRKHYVDSDQGWSVPVYDRCVHWRNRRARVWLGNQRRDGSVSADMIELASGFLDATPQVVDSGQRVQLTVVPWTAVLERQIGGAAKAAGLLQGWHYYSADGPHQIRYSLAWMRGLAYSDEVGVQSVSGQKFIQTLYGAGDSAEPYLGHADVFDVTLANVNGEPHPRAGAVYIGNGYGDAVEIADYAVDGVDAAYPALEAAVNLSTTVEVGTRVENVECEEFITWDVIAASYTAEADIGDAALKRWPGEVFTDHNAAMLTSTQGATGVGAWAGVMLHEDASAVGGADSGPALSVALNSTKHYNSFGCSLRIQPGTRPDFPLFQGPLALLNEPQQWGVIQITRGANDANGRQFEPLATLPTAYYQSYERYILLDVNLFNTTGAQSAPNWIRVEHRRGDDIRADRYAYMQISDVTASGSGYRYQISAFSLAVSPPPSMYDYPDSDRVRVVRVARFLDASPTIILLQLLLSGIGNGENDATYDVQPFGLNLETDQVDVSSFTRFEVPAQFSRWTLDVIAGDKIGDVVGPILTALSAAIVSRLDNVTGLRKLTLISMGVANSADSIATISDGDWLASGRPRSKTDGWPNDEVVNRYIIRTNYDAHRAEFDHEVEFPDQESIGANGASAPMEINLRGVRVPVDSVVADELVLRPVALNLRALLGSARKLVVGSVPHSDGVRLFAGAVVTMTAADVVDLDGSLGITNRVGRVVKITHDALRQRTDLEAIVHGYNTAGWAPALKVSAVAGAGSPWTYTVQPNNYTETTHPVTGGTQSDLRYQDVDGAWVNWFAEGQAVKLVPRGDFSSAQSATLGTIDYSTREVTIASASALAVGDVIRVRSYDSAAAAHLIYAFLADANATIGAAAVDAYVLSS